MGSWGREKFQLRSQAKCVLVSYANYLPVPEILSSGARGNDSSYPELGIPQIL